MNVMFTEQNNKATSFSLLYLTCSFIFNIHVALSISLFKDKTMNYMQGQLHSYYEKYTDLNYADISPVTSCIKISYAALGRTVTNSIEWQAWNLCKSATKVLVSTGNFQAILLQQSDIGDKNSSYQIRQIKKLHKVVVTLLESAAGWVIW